MTEKSSFDTEHQNENLNSKITAALERISNALRVLLWNESKENSLSPIQNQILIFLLFHREEYCTVSYLAEEFNITKARVVLLYLLTSQDLPKTCPAPMVMRPAENGVMVNMIGALKAVRMSLGLYWKAHY